MNKRTILIVLALAAVVAGIYAWREYHRGPADASATTAKERITATELYAAYQQDEAAADVRFHAQVVEVSGAVRGVSGPENGKVNVTLESGDPLAGVVCEFAEATAPHWGVGQNVRLKGECSGLLMDVVLVRCAPLE